MNSNRDPLELELESARPPELPADLRARIAQAIFVERQANLASVPMRWSARWLIAGAVAAAACVIVSVALFNHSRHGSTTTTHGHDPVRPVTVAEAASIANARRIHPRGGAIARAA